MGIGMDKQAQFNSWKNVKVVTSPVSCRGSENLKARLQIPARKFAHIVENLEMKFEVHFPPEPVSLPQNLSDW